MISYHDDDDDSHLTSDHYYDDYNDEYYSPYAYLQQARTPASNAQDTTQFTPIREPLEPTSLLSPVRLSNDNIKAIIKQAVTNTFRRFNLLHHDSMPSAESSRQQASMSANKAQDTTQSTPIREPSEPTSPLLIEEERHPHTCMDVAESSTNHVVESSTKRESSTIIQNITTTTPPTLKHLYAVPTSLTQAKSTPNPAPTIQHAPHTHTARFVFDPGGYTY